MENSVEGNVKTLSEHETIRIKFEGREEHVVISGDGTMSYDLITTGGSQNIFEYASQSEPLQESAQSTLQGVYHNPYQTHEAFNLQERYLEALIRVASTGSHKVHDEIDEAIKKLKELAHA